MTIVSTHHSDSKHQRVEKLKQDIIKLKGMRQQANKRLNSIKIGDTTEVKAKLIQVDHKLNMLEKRFENYLHSWKHWKPKVIHC